MEQSMISATRLVETEIIEKKWLLENLLPRVGMAAISGASNSGKSWLGLELAIDLAGGGSFFKQEFSENGPVLYLSRGEPLGATAERLKALSGGKGKEIPEGMYFDPGRLDLSQAEGVKTLREKVRQTSCKLVILDKFGQYLPKMADYSAYWMGTCLEKLREVCEGEEVCALILQQNDRIFYAKDGRYGRPSRGLSALLGQCDVVMDLSEKDGARTLSVVKNRLGESLMKLRFGIFSEENEEGKGICHLILLEKPKTTKVAQRIAEQAKLEMKRILLAQKGKWFSRKALSEALEEVMPMPRQRNLDEAFALLGKDVYVETAFEGRDKSFCWNDTLMTFGERDTDLDADAGLGGLAGKLEKIEKTAMECVVKLAVAAGMDEKQARAMAEEDA